MGFQLPSTVGRVVAVLGGGVLGRRIACSWAASGYDVVIRDPSPEQRAAAVQYCNTSMSDYSDSAKRGTVQALDDLEKAVEKAWLVVEAVPEKLDLKISTFADLEKLTTQDAVLASNSSSYKSREMVGNLQRETRRRVLNMHYYMPPGNRIVELMTDGETDETIFPFLVDKLKETGMHPYVAHKESTGLIFNRMWAAIKREALSILAEGVATPQELDGLWIEMWSGSQTGPVAMMDQIGLDTVAFIEQHYVAERKLSDQPLKFLQKFLDEGRLGAKSAKGGLLPPQQATGPAHHLGDSGNILDPTLYVLDIGLSASNPLDALNAGRIMVGSPDGRPFRTLVSNQHMPDGIDVSTSAKKLFWTSMGNPSQPDGAIFSSNLDGSHVKEIVPRGSVHTPKQLTIDHKNSKIYFGDREGLKVWRCNFDGFGLETLIQNGDWRNDEEKADQMRWCVGVTVSPSTGKFYWTQKGPSKGNKGRIFRANIDFLPGEEAGNRTDIEVMFQNLPEPIDLDIDEAANVLYWSDRGELPTGNSINSARLDEARPVQGNATSVPGRDYTLLSRDLHEAIAVKLDLKKGHVYATDLGGSLYRLDADGGHKTRIYDGVGALSGLALAYF
ncbi:3-hydroxybutyryl-CoA dehydrogenase [Metarhizium robertsii]|uniref:NAD(P)-binding domain protein n=2 Tax=Metarhizium robertsii TaxID=568076 RepID=E9F992_METRA|nr:NAD(P)-binding domain protein [Metarhizium robertsii ARSEF 23]EFY95697.1 NAD(P)-binding domain protein [Metarhizium robertsii ARSEF 23]EXU98039.1 3-hydroxybutyryl-CoA dehydrogenase [Metarhizium robertsii]